MCIRDRIVTLKDNGLREWEISTKNGFDLKTTVRAPNGDEVEVDEPPFLNQRYKDRLHIPVPSSYLEGLEPPFNWSALTFWTIRGQDSPSDDLTYIDPIPQDGLPDPGQATGSVFVPLP